MPIYMEGINLKLISGQGVSWELIHDACSCRYFLKQYKRPESMMCIPYI
ncbi:hypothetical protein MNBD_GAMMA09-2702 [hydrothermal vent metagenome]|uniref:Uncharacterized protein n=1 Tax=hydrothermal vent metagenome TaxID=652676 RepID=A0A3B0XFE5_9ZZZZ